MSTHDADLIVIGGGAAGFFGALNARAAAPHMRVLLLEKGSKFLQKVAVSGGGRCNVTHACFEPKTLVTHYPRGAKELLGPFHRWQPRDTVEWFAKRGVRLKAEPDGRMFPVTNDARTIIDCFLSEAARLGIALRKGVGVDDIQPQPSGGFALITDEPRRLTCAHVLVAVGGLKREADATFLANLGHTLNPPVPSLFSFNIKAPLLKGLAGISLPNAIISLPEVKLSERGPVLITHWGLSGPGVLKLSAWGARELYALDYIYTVFVNWSGMERPKVLAALEAEKRTHGKRHTATRPPETLRHLPERLWERLCAIANLPPACTWAHLNRTQLDALADAVCQSALPAQGKSTNKEEFVTCGGIRLDEIDLRRMESRLHPSLHFAGEVLDIDAVTGGFNFQAAWTTGYIAAQAIAEGL